MTIEHETAWPELPPGPHGTPSAALAEHYRSRPVAPITAPSGDEILAVFRQEDVKAVLSCPYSSRKVTAPGLPRMVNGMGIDDIEHVLITTDDPEHTRQRRILRTAFTVKAAERWRATCRSIANDLLDAAPGPAIDVVADYALPLSSRMICQVLGVPVGDHDRFHTWCSAFLSAASASAQVRMEAYAAFLDYGTDLLAFHRRNPGHDLVDSLLQAHDEEDRLSDGELINVLFMLITAGHETTAMMISRGVYRFLLHPEQYQALVDAPSLMGSAVNEILRYDGPGTPGLLRRLTADLELPSGTVISAGALVLPHLLAANHDPAAYEDPEKFDITRDATHLAFGHGAHHCLGHTFARMELEEAFGALTLRAPRMHPAIPLENVSWTTQDLTYQPRHLPVVLA